MQRGAAEGVCRFCLRTSLQQEAKYLEVTVRIRTLVTRYDALVTSSVLVTSSKAPVTSSDALVSTSVLLQDLLGGGVRNEYVYCFVHSSDNPSTSCNPYTSEMDGQERRLLERLLQGYSGAKGDHIWTVCNTTCPNRTEKLT